MNVTVERGAFRGRPRKTWCKVLCNDLRIKVLNREDANDRASWGAAIK